MLPITDVSRLMEWTASAPWPKLLRFLRNDGARGHDLATIDQFTRIVEQRRWVEEERTRHEVATARGQRALSQRERIWSVTDSRHQRRRQLEQLRGMCPTEFERLIAEWFNSQDYVARAVGGTADDGIDVEIRSLDGDLWAISQCKRYGASSRVSAGDVRDFAGAFMLRGASRGFLFTTGKLTRHAKRTAQGYEWLTIYSGVHLVELHNESESPLIA